MFLHVTAEKKVKKEEERNRAGQVTLYENIVNV